jgi:DNA-binding response OmpR family regulator
MDRIMGLEYGADDYVIKPFNPLELILRAEAILKRLQGDSQTSDRETLASGPFKIATYDYYFSADSCHVLRSHLSQTIDGL